MPAGIGATARSTAPRITIDEAVMLLPAS